MTPKIDNSHSLTSRAAQYVRMSTEHQSDTITKFAIAHSMEIVATYDDHGRSGTIYLHIIKELMNGFDFVFGGFNPLTNP
jgi:hypothetical protein